MKTPILICTIATTLAFALSAADKPNVLFIAIDDLRPELAGLTVPETVQGRSFTDLLDKPEHQETLRKLAALLKQRQKEEKP